MVKTKEDLTGRTFGRLTVLKQTEDYVQPNGKKSARWLCKCSCGNNKEVIVAGSMLRNGNTRSCGCLQKEIAANMQMKENIIDFESAEYAIGYTSKGEPFWFDKEDYDKIKNYCWSYNNCGYLYARDRNSKQKILFHHLVMSPIPDGVDIDHKQHPPYPGQKYDNRKSNLRSVTHSQNLMNRTMGTNNTSGNIGVSWNKEKQKWKAYITIGGKQIHVGYFVNKEDAIQARKAAELKYFGEYRYEANN